MAKGGKDYERERKARWRAANPELAKAAEIRQRARVTGRADAIRLSISIDIDGKRLGAWRPEQTAAFFDGLAKIIAARKS